MTDAAQRIPLSVFQEPLWVLHELEPEFARTQNIVQALHLQGPLRVDVLERAFQQTIRRHETLRTSFIAVKGKPVQAIQAEVPFHLSVVDVEDRTAATREAELRRLARLEARQPFNIGEAPLLRATLIRAGEEDYQLVLILHHMITDGWSMAVLTRELTALYAAEHEGRPSPLPPLPARYADFVAWQRAHATGELLQKQLAYWKDKLDGARPQIDLPGDRPPDGEADFAGERVALRLSKPLAAAVRRLCHEERVTPFMVLLAAFKTLMYRYTGQSDIVVGTFVANRRKVEFEPLIGMFVNNLALRTDLSGEPTFRQLVARARQTVLEATTHQDLPFEMLRQHLKTKQGRDRASLFQVVFSMQNAPRSEWQFADIVATRLPFSGGTSRFDLTFYVWEAGDEFAGTLEYSTRLYSPTMMTHLIRHFQVLLKAALDNPDERLGAFPLLTPAERYQLISKFNDTKVTSLTDGGIPAAFAGRAACLGDETALVCGNECVSYRELNCTADSVAALLEQRGVQPGAIVGLAAERWRLAVAGALGIFKAGATMLWLPPGFSLVGRLPTDSPMPVSAVLTDGESLERVQSLGGAAIRLDAASKMHGQRHPNGNVCPGAADPAYMTWDTKDGFFHWIRHSHSAVCNRLLGLQNASPLAAGDRFLATVCRQTGPGDWSILWPLLSGACVVLPASTASETPVESPPDRDPQAINIYHVHSSFAERLLTSERSDALSKARCLLCGSPPDDDLVRELANRFDSVHTLFEAGLSLPVACTRLENTSSELLLERPLANTQLYVLDSCWELVPPGVNGRLFVGGDSLPSGFASPVPDAFKNQSGRVLLPTGQLARYRPEGGIELILRRAETQAEPGHTKGDGENLEEEGRRQTELGDRRRETAVRRATLSKDKQALLEQRRRGKRAPDA